jgi:hypothetical protein
MGAYSWCAGNDFKKFLSICTGIQHTVSQRASKLKAHIQRLPGRAFVQPGKIETDANERAVIEKSKLLFRLHHLRFFP